MVIAYGADVDAQTHSPSYESDQEASFWLTNEYDAYGKNDISRTALMFAAEKNSFDVIKLLIRESAELEAVDTYGQTAMMYAAAYDSAESLILLIDAGAKRAAKSKAGDTALSIARERNCTTAEEILLSK